MTIKHPARSEKDIKPNGRWLSGRRRDDAAG